jgi:membrane-associated phospholipid phosphatase
LLLGLFHLILLISSIVFLLPRYILKQPIRRLWSNSIDQIPWLFLIICVVILHLFEVNILDPWTTSLVGTDYASLFISIEGTIVANISLHWNTILLAFFVIMYIVVYPFILWFSTVYFCIDHQKKALHSLSIGLLVLYIISLPFYLFFPVSNVYITNNLASSLTMIFPHIDHFFYMTTTSNNCFPSLHVGMSLLICWSAKQTNNKRYYFFTLFSLICVIISVFYLAIHWIIDVIGGILVATAAIIISNTVLKKRDDHEPI